MTDSLHRACPARFSGSDLSRPVTGKPAKADGTPASAAISSRASRRCKGFLPVFPWQANGDGAAPWTQARLLTFSTELPLSLPGMRPFAGARPHGHPPLSLRPPLGGLFFSAAGVRAPSLCWRYRLRYRSGLVRRRASRQRRQAHAPGTWGRAASDRHRPVRLSVSGRRSPRREPWAIREAAVVVRRPYGCNRPTASSFRAGFFHDFGYRSGQLIAKEVPMRFRIRRAAAGVVLSLAIVWPAFAATSDDQFKSDIETFLNKLGTTTHGVLSWEGADSFEVRRDGDAAVATITNARLTLHEAKSAELV